MCQASFLLYIKLNAKLICISFWDYSTYENFWLQFQQYKELRSHHSCPFYKKKRWTNWKKMIFYTHQRSEIARQTITLETDGKKTARALFHAGEVHSFHFSPTSLPVSPEDGGVGRNKHWRNSCEAPSKRQRLTKRLWFNHRIMECFCSPTLYHHTNRLQHSGL